MGEPIKSGEVERTESFDRQGNQTTRVFIRTTYFDYSPEYKNKISFVCISFHSCIVLLSLEAPLVWGRFATTCSG